MADLRTNSQRLTELFTFIKGREGVLDYFYVDNMGYVTIGIGTLVDAKGDNIDKGLAVLRKVLAAAPGVQFINKITKQPASAREIEADWAKVKKAYLSAKASGTSIPERRYKDIADLVLASGSNYLLWKAEVFKSIAEMYKQRPASINLDEYIQMALIDVRYNPAGVNPFYTGEKRISRLWALLNASDLDNAFKEFHQLWHVRIADGHSKNKTRYLGRQATREAWFQQGITRMHLKNMVPSFLKDVFDEFEV
jgi:GH24 family phage-related lysozyme (muramidase)